MEQGKAKRLEKEINELKGLVATLSSKVDEQHKLLNGSLMVFKDLDAQVQTLKGFMIENKLMTEDKYEETVDERRGLKLLTKADHIAVGDIAWVDYVAMVDGKEVARDENLPIRVGAGAVNFELALVGHLVGDAVQHDHTITEEGEFNGKVVNFAINIRKAKTKIEDADGSTEPATEDQTLDQSGGPGLEEHHDSASGDVRGQPATPHSEGTIVDVRGAGEPGSSGPVE